MLHVSCYVIYTVHGWVFNEPKRNGLFYKWAEKLTSIFKDKLICVSEFDRQATIKEKICSKEKLITIHNGIAPIHFLSKEEARKKLSSIVPPLISKKRGLGGEVLIGSIGNLYKTKGFEYLIEAAKILISNFKLQISFIIIGEGKERKRLERLIKKNNLQHNFVLAGKIDNAAQLLPAFDLYVCSSVKEGLSYTIIEAMQAGLPIIATQVGGNPELIKNNQTGLLTETKNPPKLAEKIKELVNNPELGKRFGANAQVKARREFSLEKMVEKTKEVYDK